MSTIENGTTPSGATITKKKENTDLNKYQTLFRKVMSDYPEYDYRIEKCATQCLTDKNPVAILFNKEDYENCTEEDVFDLLHEIGHAKTNSDHNARCVREFEATKWAVAHAPEYGIKISEKRKKIFQDDVYYWREIQVKYGKYIESKHLRMYCLEKLKIDWGEV